LLIGSYLARHRGGFTPDIVVGLVIYTCVMGGVYILNQIMDIETDRINKKLFLLSEGHIPVPMAYCEMIIIWIIALILSIQFGSLFVALILLSLVLGIFYSVPPIKLKGKPLLDTLSNGVGYGIINFSIGWLLVRPFEWSMIYRFLPYVFFICAVFINTTIVDIEGDMKAREHTTAIVLGEQLSFTISTICVVCAILVAYILKDLVCLLPALVSLPFFVYAAFYRFIKNRVNRRLTITSFRVPGLLLTVITVFLYPIYIFVLIAVFLGMRIYYKHRFGITYPTLTHG
jgi:4-hydroxybenzoate polyprenyltransferase